MASSLLSRIVLTGVCTAAAAGWFGVRVAVPGEAQTVAAAGVDRAGETIQISSPPSVRNRDAWQPSPVATQGLRPGQPATDGVPQSPMLPPLRVAPALGGALPIPVPPAGSWPAVAPDTLPYVPSSHMFTAERLERAFGGMLPDVRGNWHELRFLSRSLGREVGYMAWLPPGYAASGQAYPTLYLLHGVGGPDGFGVEEWLGYALTEDLDRMLALGLIQPMIVILPHGEQGYWMNHAEGGPRWADFVADDLVKHVDATLHTDPRREKRAIGGLSMGAHGALQLALNHADVFSVAGAHSPTLRPFEDSPEFFGDQQWFARYDPLTLARSTDAALRITTWIDAGHDDKWQLGAQAVADTMRAKNAPVTYTVLEGEHEGWYWGYYLPEYLNFYSTALNATAMTPYGAPAVDVLPLGTHYNAGTVMSLASPGSVSQ